VEEVGELHPGFTRQGGLGAGSEDEEAYGRRGEFGVLPGVAAAGSWGMEGVSKRWDCVRFLEVWYRSDVCLPLKLFNPSAVMRPFLRLYGLISFMILATVMGYVSSLVACRISRSSFSASKSLV
jgi:hypothetical protein